MILHGENFANGPGTKAFVHGVLDASTEFAGDLVKEMKRALDIAAPKWAHNWGLIVMDRPGQIIRLLRRSSRRMELRVEEMGRIERAIRVLEGPSWCGQSLFLRPYGGH